MKNSTSRSSHRYLRFLLLTVFLGLLLFAVDLAKNKNFSAAVVVVQPPDESNKKTVNDDPAVTSSHLALAKEVQRIFQEQKRFLEDQVYEMYGTEYGQVLFAGSSRYYASIHQLLANHGNTKENDKDNDKDNDKQDSKSLSWERLVRKMQIKLLQMQLNYLNTQRYPHSDRPTSTSTSTSSSSSSTTIVWVNGGHSSSAGHGNFLRESYSKVMERLLQHIFASINIQFTVRVRGMGDTSSGDEVALCMAQLFGTDADIITWDYGLTDGKQPKQMWKIAMYAYRAAHLSQTVQDTSSIMSKDDQDNHYYDARQRPALFAIHAAPGHMEAIQELEQLGMTMLGQNQTAIKHLRDALPDMMGLNSTQISKLPKYLQYFKCQNAIEKGDPGCSQHKFNQSLCYPRYGTTSWHPGWKSHALDGIMITITLLQILEQAIERLVQLEPYQYTAVGVTSSSSKGNGEFADVPSKEVVNVHLETLFHQLNQEEQDDYDRIFQSPMVNMQALEQWKGSDNTNHSIPIETIISQPILCHTARLPSQSRYLGILVNDNIQEIRQRESMRDDEMYSTTKNSNHSGFYTGTNYTVVEQIETGRNATAFIDTTRPQLLHEFPIINALEQKEVCKEETTLIDHPDYFYLSSLMPERTLTLPNDAERIYYNDFNTASNNTQQGFILICFRKWNRRTAWPEGNLRETVVNSTKQMTDPLLGTFRMTINGKLVTELTPTGGGHCYALAHEIDEQGYKHDTTTLATTSSSSSSNPYQWEPNSQGLFEIKAQIFPGQERSYLYITSFIIL